MSSYTTKEDELYSKHLPERATAITLDLFIGNTDYLGKGLSLVMIQQLLLQKYLGVYFVFIDPEVTNEKAIYIYKKAGFIPLVEFTTTCDLGSTYLLMRLSMKELISSSCTQ